MFAKGVDFYHYSDATDLRTEFTAPQIKHTLGPEANFRRNNLQISSSKIEGLGSYTGTLQFITRRGTTELISQFQDINSFDGKLGRGTMANMFKTPPLIGDTIVCWGFYDAGPGKAAGSALPNQNQHYVYATRDHRQWMTELAARNPDVQRQPFFRFALPGAHDAGMFDMTAVMRMLNSPALVTALLASLALIPIVGPLIAAAGGIGRAFAPRALANLSMTQKDDVRTMLDIGTRFFDFRPGVMHPALSAFSPGVRFHQHGVVPGYPYIAFLEDVLRWLGDNPGEIVVVNANTAGFASDKMKPSARQLEQDLATAMANVAGREIKIGNKSHLRLTYPNLIRENLRLIFLNQIEDETSKFDSWKGENYKTLTPGPVIEAFERMTRGLPHRAHADYVVMQMQATSTGVGAGVVAPAIVTFSDASSPLLATKPIMDAATNPWLRANALRLPQDHLLVLLNDFVDNCMVETAIRMTEQRAAEATRIAAGPFPTRRGTIRPVQPLGRY